MINLHVLFGFNGRIRRLQWWVGSLVMFGMVLAILFIGSMVMVGTAGPNYSDANPMLAIVLLVAYVIALWSQLALGVKRLHDRDNTGWLMLLGFVPLLGFVLFVMLGFLDGTQGPNRFGRSPKGIGGDTGDSDLSSVFS